MKRSLFGNVTGYTHHTLLIAYTIALSPSEAVRYATANAPYARTTMPNLMCQFSKLVTSDFQNYFILLIDR
ncbi:hypothetical protein [Floridanema aerugineum]|uniref:Uncharacterized protein n=1 Tax=Floridaenema aerugineum BLCC-F46 TaxID=3153654 RepID=A0ABV4X9F6_9CYAN